MEEFDIEKMEKNTVRRRLFERIPFVLLAVQLLLFAFFSVRGYPSDMYSSTLPMILWWGIALTGIVALLSRFSFRRASILLFHLSFILILLGAFITHVTGDSAELYLQKDVPVRQVVMNESGQLRNLPHVLLLKDFQIEYYPGTDVAANYKSVLQVGEAEENRIVTVSMNHIYKEDGFRIYQSSFDPSLQSCTMKVCYDKWGVRLTYSGYVMLIVTMLLLLFDKKNGFRKALKSPIWKTLVIMAFVLLPGKISANPDLPTFDQPAAEQFGRILIQHQNRITTVESYASDFLRKIYGKNNYNGYTATQVLCGWIMAPQTWQYEPMFKVKGKDVKEKLNLPSKARLVDFFDADGEYRLRKKEIGLSAENYYDGKMKNWAKMDEKIELVVSLQSGKTLKIYPFDDNEGVRLLSPVEVNGKSIPKEDSLLVNCFFPLLYDAFQKQQDAKPWIEKFVSYQKRRLGTAAPSDFQMKAEHLYNNIYAVPVVSYVTVTVGILAFVLLCLKLGGKNIKWSNKFFFSYLLCVWSYLTILLTLRTIVSERPPFSNGYETLLLVAWLAQTISLLFGRRFRLLYIAGIIISGFSMLTASISNMDPQISPLMPVLNSPLLSLHVSLMMISYTLAGFMTLIAISSIVIYCATHRRSNIEAFAMVNRVLLYPTTFFMTIGIFIGAVWANVSWGSYWSWDPKETWALIAMLVYGFAFHQQSIPFLRHPLKFQVYIALAILAVLTTYFGVNYFMGGMHSYAN